MVLHNGALAGYFAQPKNTKEQVTFTLPAYDVVLMEVEFEPSTNLTIHYK